MRQFDVDQRTAWVMLAALSAEPETWDEFSSAVRRYQPRHSLCKAGRELDRIPGSASDDSPWCLIDLIGRTVVAGRGFELPEPAGAYRLDPGEPADGPLVLWLDTPADWVFWEATPDWEAKVAQRADAARQRKRVDLRAVLFGTPLHEFLAQRVLACAKEHSPQDAKAQLKWTRIIHADWLMTPRADLGGRTPRECLLAQRRWIDRVLEHRAEQWLMHKQAPPGLSPESAAYRWGGFGTGEVVLYFELVRTLLDDAWQRVIAQPTRNHEQLVAILARRQQQWLNSPIEDGDEATATEIIESERRRIPCVSHNPHALFDDCPICQAMAAQQAEGPVFMWFDGHYLELEDEFAFSLAESREEWESERLLDDCWDKSPDATGDDQASKDDSAERSGRQAHAVEGRQVPALVNQEGPDAFGTIWQTSYVDWDEITSPDAPPQLALEAIGFPLAELVYSLKARQERERVDQLNQVYVQLCRAQDPVAAGSAARQLRDDLEQVALAYPELVAKSADLQSHLDEILRRL